MNANTIAAAAGLVAVLAAATGSIYLLEDRYAAAGDVELAQAKSAVQLQRVAKESRLRDIEMELREIDKRAQAARAYPGDAARRQWLLDERRALLAGLELLK